MHEPEVEIATLEEFLEEFSRVLIPGQPWGRNFGEFNDLLRGGFCTPSGKSNLKVRNSYKPGGQTSPEFSDA